MWIESLLSAQLLKKKFGQKGSVLIEFAFCCPVLVILIFFVLDVPLAYRVILKMQKMSELTACMIRNTPNKYDTKITLNNLKNISKAAGITLTGKLGSKEKPCRRYPFYLSTYVFCVKGNSSEENSASFDTLWAVHIKNNLYEGDVVAVTDDTALTYSKLGDVSSFTNIKELSNYRIKEGEVKLIIETVAWYNKSDSATMEGVSSDSEGGDYSSMLGDYKKNQHVVRGFNKNFYLLTIPGRSIIDDVYAFGYSYSVMPCVEDIIDTDKCPELGE
jgi:hypothetical protein